jgi:hypothetical protein
MESTLHAASRKLALSKPHELRPARVAAITLVAYLAILSPVVAFDGVTSFLHVGSTFTHLSERQSPIRSVPTHTEIGYDGQFAYFIALDPRNARFFMDRPAYRYGRILYPVVAWAAALGQPGALPFTLLAVNVLAVAGTIWLLAAYLRRRETSPWWAAVYGFFPGLLLCLLADLTEPLAFFLTACGIVLLDRRTDRWLSSAGLFALAALARETTLVFAAAAAISIALRGRRGWRLRPDAILRTLSFSAISALPLALYRLALDHWLGTGPQESGFSLVPFAGLAHWRLDDTHQLVLLAVVVPGLAWLLLSARAALGRGAVLPVGLVAVNAALFVVWLPLAVYLNFGSASRASTGLALAVVLSLPTFLRLMPRSIVACACLLLSLGWALVAAGIAAA